MAGGLLQIVAYGVQDMYLTNNPQITFFKVVYRRHTNFSTETFEHTVQNNPNFGSVCSIILPRTGDLITKMYLKIVVPSFTPPNNSRFAWVRRLGHALIKNIDITIGGSKIDRQTGTWLDIWYELARTKNCGYPNILGDVSEMTEYSSNTKPEYTLFIPLKFWFNRHTGLALPLIAIQYHQIELNIEFSKIEDLIITNNGFDNTVLSSLKFLDVSVLSDYVYLDNKERDRFASVGHEYLIEQIQFTDEESVIKPVKREKIHFNFPVKELVWCMRNGNYTTGKRFLCYTHKTDKKYWQKEILRSAKQLLIDSIILLKATQYTLDMNGNTVVVEDGDSPPPDGNWVQFVPMSRGATPENNLSVTNNNTELSVWINTESLKVDGTEYSLVDKIFGSVIVAEDGTTILRNITTTLSVRDVSTPIELMIDTRTEGADSTDIRVNQFTNYGTLIDGTHNPVQYAQLEFNRVNRFDKRKGNFFNYLQPELHHSNTPADGINMYSFCIEPEVHQPTGTANFSRVENIILTVWYKDPTQKDDNHSIDILNLDSRMYLFGLSYNMFRVMNGLSGLSYN